MNSITVIKQDAAGEEMWRYAGRVLKRDGNRVVLEAYFNRQDMRVNGMPLRQGDRFIETYYIDRWYNIFEIHDGKDDCLRGWYINISHPAIIAGDTLSYRDLALDVLVFPNGNKVVLDEDEFEALDISPVIREKALAALAEIRTDRFWEGILHGAAF